MSATPLAATAGQLPAADLYRPCDPSRFPFQTTAELPQSALVSGQDRAVAALQFGLGVRRDGYNLFVLSPSGAGRHTITQVLLQEHAARESPASDWCYVYNFDTPQRPLAISFPSGGGAQFRHDMAPLVRDLQTPITAALESDQYRRRRHARFPPLSVNDRVERRLIEFAQQSRAFRVNDGAARHPK